MKERARTLPPKLRRTSDDISQAIDEAKKIRELTIKEEVSVELDKVSDTLQQAKKQIAKLLHA